MRHVLPLLIVVALSGCFGDPSVEESFPDADARFVRTADDLDDTFEVPEGNVTVVVAVHYRLEPEATFAATVSVVDGPELANIDQDGPVEEKDRRWLTIRNVTAGTWRIEADLQGDGAYVFAAYFEDRPTATP